jgi:hypothetical protein
VVIGGCEVATGTGGCEGLGAEAEICARAGAVGAADVLGEVCCPAAGEDAGATGAAGADGTACWIRGVGGGGGGCAAPVVLGPVRVALRDGPLAAFERVGSAAARIDGTAAVRCTAAMRTTSAGPGGAVVWA